LLSFILSKIKNRLELQKSVRNWSNSSRADKATNSLGIDEAESAVPSHPKATFVSVRF